MRFVELDRDNGQKVRVRADEIGVILESVTRPKDGEARPCLVIHLRNNTTVTVMDVTMEQVFSAMEGGAARIPVFRPDGSNAR